MLSLGVCFPQPYLSTGCRFAVSRSRLNYWGPLRSFLHYTGEHSHFLFSAACIYMYTCIHVWIHIYRIWWNALWAGFHWIRMFRSNKTQPWCWIFLERTRILSGIQFTWHFIEFFVVKTEQFVGSSVNVTLTRQLCGQRLSMSAGSRRQALGNYFPELICYMLLMTQRRGDCDLSLCAFWVLA